MSSDTHKCSASLKTSFTHCTEKRGEQWKIWVDVNTVQPCGKANRRANYYHLLLDSFVLVDIHESTWESVCKLSLTQSSWLVHKWIACQFQTAVVTFISQETAVAIWLSHELKRWSSHLLDNRSDCLICAPEKFHVRSTGFKPMTSAMTARSRYQLCYEAMKWLHRLSSKCEFIS